MSTEPWYTSTWTYREITILSAFFYSPLSFTNFSMQSTVLYLSLSLSLCHLAVWTCSTFLDKPLDALWMWIWTSDSWQSLDRCLCLCVHAWVCGKGLSKLPSVKTFASTCTLGKTNKELRTNLWSTHRCRYVSWHSWFNSLMKRMHGHANPKYAGACCADITHVHHQPADDVINRSPGSVPDGNWSKRGSSCSPGLQRDLPCYNNEQREGALQQLGLICHLQLFLGTWHHKLFFKSSDFFGQWPQHFCFLGDQFIYSEVH